MAKISIQSNINIQDKDTIEKWLTNLMNCDGGFAKWEKHFEYSCPREIAFAAFVLRCLANPECEGSEMVFNSILQDREFFGGELPSFGF